MSSLRMDNQSHILQGQMTVTSQQVPRSTNQESVRFPSGRELDLRTFPLHVTPQSYRDQNARASFQSVAESSRSFGPRSKGFATLNGAPVEAIPPCQSRKA